MKPWKTILTLACAAFILDGTMAYAATTGDFRTRDDLTDDATYSWDADDLWEEWDGDSWEQTTDYPDSTGDHAVTTLRSLSGTDNYTVNVNVTDAATAQIEIQTRAKLTIASTARLEIAGNSSVADADGWEINGSVTVDQGELLVSQATIVSGGGSIKMNDSNAAINVRDSGEALTLNATTIHGIGQIFGDGTFDNEGIVDADASGVLLLTVNTVQSNSGDRRWRSTNGSAELDFSAGSYTSMAGGFYITAGEIEVNTTALTTAGRLEMTGGALDVNADLTMGSDVNLKYMIMTGGTIDVEAADVFTHY